MTPGSIIITTWAIIVLFCLIVIYPFLLILSLLRPHSVDIYLVALAIFVFGTPLLFASLTYILKVARVDFYRSWPFIYFWRFFTIRPKRRGWTVQDQSYSRAERHLCSTCTNISSRSKLLIGSKLIFTWRTEWHEINNTLDGLDPSGQSGCHFCSILWHSVPDFIRREDPIEDARPEEQPVVRSHWFYLFHRRTQKPLQRGTKLRLKIWEELEGLRYKQHECFVQLYRGKVPLCKGIPIKKGQLSLHNQDRKLSTSTRDRACMSLARSWIHKCATLGEHEACNAQWAPQDFLPTRLIYVGENTKSNDLHLHVTVTKGPEIQYLALSHCWGKTKFLTLKEENKKDMLQNIDYDSLPSNFKDAIYFTRKMGFQYLWIDSLCIIQDSKEDWEKESKAMCNIYAKAFCTIFSNGSVDAYGGCFHERNPFQYAPCELLSSEDESLTCQLRTPNPFLAQVEYAPLNQRAWVFQERMLSRRIVHFGSSLLLFECRTQYLSELQESSIYLGREFVTMDGFHFNNQKFRYLFGNNNMDHEYTYASSIADSDGRLGRRLSFHVKPNPMYRLAPIRESILSSPVVSNRGAFFALRKNQDTASVHEEPLPLKQQLRLHQNWFQLVEAYTSANLTHTSDRTIAMLGVALSIKGQRRDIHYFAGLWCHFVSFDLLWCVAESPRRRPQESRAPSWSWMSVDGKVSQRILPFTVASEKKKYSIEKKATVHRIGLKEIEHQEQRNALVYRGHLDLICRVLRVQEIQKSGVCLLWGKRVITATFFPDFQELLNPTSELFCVEILGMSIKEPERRPPLSVRELIFRNQNLVLWSLHGLVLRRHSSGVSPQGYECYERVGRFWMDLGSEHEYRHYETSTVNGCAQKIIRII